MNLHHVGEVVLMFGILLMIGGITGLICCHYMLFRNRWVYRTRMTVLFRDQEEYMRLASYDEMMRRWWIWDVDAFIAASRRPEIDSRR